MWLPSNEAVENSFGLFNRFVKKFMVTGRGGACVPRHDSRQPAAAGKGEPEHLAVLLDLANVLARLAMPEPPER